jgi:tight adherence protein B
MDPLVIATGVLVALAVFLVVNGLLTGKKPEGADAIASRLQAFKPDYSTPVTTEEKVAQLRKRSYSGLPFLSGFLAQFKGSEKVALHLERAGVPLRVGEYYLIRWGLAAVLFFAPFIFGFSVFTIFFGLAFAFGGYMLPAYWVGSKKRARMRRIEAQLVDMLGLVSNSLKSGYGLMQSFEFASKQMDPPLALEIRRMLREANLGLAAEDALIAMGERIGSKDLDMVLTAINIQRAVGGNLAEILDKVAFTMRERERIRGDITTLTSQQRMTGIIIGALPVFMFVLFMIMNPAYMSLLFTDMVGRIMLSAAIGLEFMGFLTIRQLMSIEI